ncbi:2-dehydro-3-deoxygalactonokinase [Sphingomonas sp.]|jgi:2-dehydro-3-deoxygalactonokinase|uniref:2-dehydro-3-deoxygalactonokinase n=1 Tax=Sphingomonas sp. TaxID=28214 RepID=UPI002D7E819C|nr:2-dehydro-3-deoxygalactonokinase [Sphingomonas sp.]HEU0044221.1 2-dehydro-3-deoxygalactonokinase [Sphingomonas sp.]
MSRWAEGGFVAVDWGSTARRAYLIDGDGRVVDQMEDDAGTLVTPRDRFPGEVAALRARFGSKPLLMAGMVGSNRGWQETPYVPCPASLDALAQGLLWVEPGQVAIVPGLSLLDGDRSDVMRGEEVQVFGIAALEARTDAMICHPGTHSKWIELAGGAVTGFRTVMTGELFALLRGHSILADLLAGKATAGPAFADGVERGMAGAVIGAELFGVRAGVLLGRRDAADAPSLVSGLLIGSDLRAGLASIDAGRDILVVGRGSLTALYATAFTIRGHPCREIDGATALVAGMNALAATIA